MRLEKIDIQIDLDLWIKSYQQNPDPDNLYTTQINSTKELLERCQQLCGQSSNSTKVGAIKMVITRLNEIMTHLKQAESK